MSWIFLILLSITLTSFSSVLQRLMLKDDQSDPVAYSVFFQFITSLVLLAVGLFIGDIDFTNLSESYFNLFVVAVTYSLGNIFVFASLKQTEVSKFTILFASRALFSALGFFIILNDSIGINQIIGGLLILLGIFVVNYQKASWKINKGDLYALLAGLSFGLANINDKIALQKLSLYTFLFLGFILPPILVIAIRPKVVSKMKSIFNKSVLRFMALSIFLYGIGAITFFVALSTAPSPTKVTTINLLQVILTVILGIFILKEKEHKLQKFLGAILSIAGLYLVI